MKPSEIEVGDELKIRSWNDMVNEFGTDRRGNILCDGVFMRFMEHICDAPFTVKAIHGTTDIRFISEEGSGDGFCISADMLEPRKADNKPEESDEDFSVRLSDLFS